MERKALRFQCDVCRKTFSQRSNLKRHSLTHTGEKPFQCEVCQKSFTQSAHLKAHLSIHNKDSNKPFQCDICQKRFSLAGHLGYHMVTHYQERQVDRNDSPNRSRETSVETLRAFEESGSPFEGSFGYHFLDTEDRGWAMEMDGQAGDINPALGSDSFLEVEQEDMKFCEEIQARAIKGIPSVSPTERRKKRKIRQKFIAQRGDESIHIDKGENGLVVSICSDEDLEKADLLYLEDETQKELCKEKETGKTSLLISKASLSDGMITFVCHNVETAAWMLKTIPTIKARKPGTGYRIWKPGHDHLNFIASLTHQRSATDAEVFEFLLRRANPMLAQDEIKLLGIVRDDEQKAVNDKDENLVRIMFHRNHLSYLKKCNFNLSFGWGQLELKGPEVAHCRGTEDTEGQL